MEIDMKKVLGYIAYEGPSEIDGKPIVVIVNKLDGSDNAKTGADLVQTFIIRSDVPPTEALKSGDDVSICGECLHRPILAKKTGAAPCYVNVGRSVRSVYEAYRRGRYVSGAPLRKILAGRKVRLGTYGDPAAAPVSMWQDIIADTLGHVGYSHQWQTLGFDHTAWSDLVMASTESVEEVEQARSLGMRSFRVSVGVDKQRGEVVCPASAEGGRKATCDKCMLCGGASVTARNIVIADHAVGHQRRVIQLATA
jgi:hypothetical protein